MLRKLVMIVILFTVLVSCSNSKEDNAKKLIENYLNENLHDPDSYESIKFSGLTGYAVAKPDEDDNECTRIKKISDEILVNEGLIDRVEKRGENTEYYQNEIIELNKQLDSINPKGDLKCYSFLQMRHRYRAKNMMGALSLHESTFIFSKEPLMIIDIISK